MPDSAAGRLGCSGLGRAEAAFIHEARGAEVSSLIKNCQALLHAGLSMAGWGARDGASGGMRP